MNKKLAIFLIMLALVVGATCGFTITNCYWTHLTKAFYSNAMAAQTGTDVHLLTWLRSNDATNTIELLEVQLDGSIIGLGDYLKNCAGFDRDPTQVKILQQAKAYRTKFAHKSGSSSVDEAISNAFLLVNVDDKSKK